MYKTCIKHLIDLILAFSVLIIISPVFVLILFLLFVKNRGKPFFLQQRPGKNEKIFRIIKFKTMNDKKNVNGVLLSDEQRLTTIGRIIRKTSLDELPQLINVLKGDMSLVGPRPLLPEYLALYDEIQKRRHEVRPGITGWAQVNGRNAISWKQKFEFDVWYVDHITFLLDIKILFLTLKKVVVREGISAEGQATMEYFNGN
ncbi:sugar transferase [Membranihabitans maritimus]|uniref:sugar transferase n=1 Tax=Membranihabitans maritimus TaxID=2904244 RepID=UPI001F40ED37|nr:sugar transferase [Membranihabitans maritimus]